jgi:uncharacterized glyoxalase superfamily protein PhnB
MPVSTYLFFNGNCAEAMRFYERTLGGKLETTDPEAVRQNVLGGSLRHGDGPLRDALDGRNGTVIA